jgi:two-component system NarL family sensor kinase
MKKYSFALLLLFAFCKIQAQRNKPIIDSIERIIKIQTDSNLVKSYSELVWQYRIINREKAIDYGRKGIALGKKINFAKGLAQVYNDLGIIYYDKELYDSSIALYNEALKIRQQLNDDLGVARLYNKIGVIYQRQGDFSKSLYYQQNALSLFEKTNDNLGTSYALNNIGILQQNLGRYDEAINYHNQSIAIKQKMNDKQGLAQSYVNVANIFKIKEEYNKAEDYYTRAVDVSRQLGNKEYLSNALNNLGALQQKLKKNKQAKENILESYELRTSLNDTKGKVSCLNNLGDILIEEGKYDSAKIVVDKSELLARNGINTKPELMMVYQTQSKLNEKIGNATTSLDYYKKYAAYKDSLFNSNMSNKFTELEAKFNTLEKEKLIQQQQSKLNKNLYDSTQQKLLLSQNELEIAGNELEIKKQNELILEQRLDSNFKSQQIFALNKENKINALELKNEKLENNRKNILLIVIGVIAVLLLLLVYSFYRRYKLKKEKQLQLAIFKQQELATKAILEAEENERKRIAGDLHDGVGQLMSAAKMNLSAMECEIPFANEEQKKVYQKVLNLVDESCKEVRTVSHNMMPNALVKAGLASAVREFINQIDVRVIKTDLYTEGLNERIDSNVETVLYRVIQECVNNVIKHAAANYLDISLIKDADGIAVTIEDNGKGFNTSHKNNFEGIGLKNIQTRIEYLKGTVEWNSAEGKGTLVAIHIPVGS